MSSHQVSAQRMENLSEYFFARANQKIAEIAQTTDQPVINLGIGNPDLPPHDSVIEALHDALLSPTAHGYPPYNGLPALRTKIAEWYHQRHQTRLDPATQIFPTAGSKQGIVHFTMAVIDQDDEVLLPNPGYSTYEKAVSISGGKIIHYQLKEERGFLPDIAELAAMDLSRVKLMWINFPNNPTGAVASREDLEEILAFTRKHQIILANDNPYSNVTFDGFVAPSLLDIAQPDDLVIEFNSLSKTYNMAGWRIGWSVGHPELVGLLNKMNNNIETGTFLPLQWAAVKALELPDEWITERNQVYADRRAVVIKIMEGLGCKTFVPKATLYVWAKLPEHVKNSEQFAFELLEKTGVFITPGTAFGSGGEGYLRASLCQPVEKLREALERISHKQS